MAKRTAKKKTSRKKSVNKTQAILDYLAKNKAAGPAEVAAALTKKGIKVTPSYVSNVKSKGAKQAKGKRIKVKVSKQTPESTPFEDVKHAGELMIKAVELVVAAGAKEAQQLVTTASDIVKKIRE